jgi:hypothetical protein
MAEAMTHERPDGPHGRGAAREPAVWADGDLEAALRAVVAEQLRADVPEAEIGGTLQPVLRLARARGVPAARVVIAAKHAWAALPEVRRLGDPARQARLLERLVAMCVERYYAD